MNRSFSGKVLRLAGFLFRLYHQGRIGWSQARNALDRLATRMDKDGHPELAEKISLVYMRVV